MWLCPEHQAMTRVTVLTNDIILDVSHTLKTSAAEEAMVHYLRDPAHREELKAYITKWPHGKADLSYYTGQIFIIIIRYMLIAGTSRS